MRLSVKKTYKIYIDGQFPRSESGRHYAVHSASGDTMIANACLSSRKDVRNAVSAARKAFDGWAKRTCLNRGQILYRIAEICESRSSELAGELTRAGLGADDARAEVEASIDTWIYYAGWADKFAHMLGTVNPVAGAYYNFSTPEPTGVVGVIAPETPSLLGLVSSLAPAIVSGNTVVAIASQRWPLVAISLSEVLATSDVPGGVVNILTGDKGELGPWLASHRDVNALDTTGAADDARPRLEEAAADNIKRVVAGRKPDERSLYAVADFLEIKTVWHPMAL